MQGQQYFLTFEYLVQKVSSLQCFLLMDYILRVSEAKGGLLSTNDTITRRGQFSSLSKHKYQFGKKRQTSHEKGKCPAAAMTKRRGKVNLAFIEEKANRQQVRHRRKTGLFKKAMEYATLTGDSIRLQIRDEYFDGAESGLVHTPNPTGNKENSPVKKNAEGDNEIAGCSNVMMSPKAIRSKIQTADSGVQCSLIENTYNYLGNDRHCRICGARYEKQTRKDPKLWIGCEFKDCNYWLEAKCLLGNSKKITPQFCCTMPYLCPIHRH